MNAVCKYLLIGFLFISSFSQAQKLNFHSNYGFILSQIDGDERGGFRKIGYNIGAGFLIPKTDNYNIDLNLRLNQKGVREAGISTRLNYLEASATFNYLFGEYFLFGAGLGYGYLIAHNTVLDFNTAGGLRRSDVFPFIQLGFKLGKRTILSTRLDRSVISIRRNSNTVLAPAWFNRNVLVEIIILAK